MVRTEQLAEVALSGDALKLRSLVQDWLQENPRIIQTLPPSSSDATVLTVAAGLIELLAEHRRQEAPSWTRAYGPSPHPIFLVRSARTMRRLRELCEAESPAPLRRRNLFAPPNFLQQV